MPTRLPRLLIAGLLAALAPFAVASAPGASAGPASTLAGSPTVAARPAAPTIDGPYAPISVTVDRHGTSYLGYAGNDFLSVVSPTGRLRPPIPLGQTRPVEGLVAQGNLLWVGYDDAAVALDLSRGGDGRVVRRIDVPAGASSCHRDAYRSAGRYGGLSVSADTVYVTERCRPRIDVLDRRTGRLRTYVRLPGGQRARGVVFRAEGRGRNPRLYVALPDAAAVVVYRADTLRPHARPIARTTITRPTSGGRRPQPSGLAVTGSRGTQLAVSDVTNQAIYLYSVSGTRLFRYRVLGHPPHPGRSVGYLRGPVDIAQFPQGGSKMSGNLYIADRGNRRVQRWDSGSGATVWARVLTRFHRHRGSGSDQDGSDSGGRPSSTRNPSISSATSDGTTTLTCDPGTWSGGHASYAYRWLRDGAVVAGATSSTYRLGQGDTGHTFVCRVTVTNAEGSGTADSPGYYTGQASRPVNDERPVISGTPRVGRTLSCSSGRWTAKPPPTYAYQWLRGGIPVADDPSYVVTSDDAGHRLACTVTATNQAGSASATSASVAVRR